MFNSVLSIFSSVNSKHRLKAECNHKLTEYGVDVKENVENKHTNTKNNKNILHCYNCTRFNNCNLFKEYINLKNKLKDLKLLYYGFIIDPMNRDRTDIAREHKQVFLNLLDVKYKINKCLNKRIYLHKNTRYDCFIEGDVK